MIKKISYIESNTTNPYFNLALEEILFNACAKNEVILYLWRNSNTVVLGKNQNVWRECNVTKIDDDAIIVTRRMSGGGAVFHDIGNLNFTFICHRDNYNVYRHFNVIIDALEAFGINAEKSGRNDIIVNGKKFSGNAFYQRGDLCYHHGTLMVDVNTKKISKYLTVSKDKLKSNGVKSVKSRVINLVDIEPTINIVGLKCQLKESFEKIYGKKSKIIYPADIDICDIAILMDKYSSWDWVFGRKINFQYELTNKFPWGELVLQFNVTGGFIDKLCVYCDSMDIEIANKIESWLSGMKYDREELCKKLETVKKSAENSIYGTQIDEIILDLIKWFSFVEL